MVEQICSFVCDVAVQSGARCNKDIAQRCIVLIWESEAIGSYVVMGHWFHNLGSFYMA